MAETAVPSRNRKNAGNDNQYGIVYDFDGAEWAMKYGRKSEHNAFAWLHNCFGANLQDDSYSKYQIAEHTHCHAQPPIVWAVWLQKVHVEVDECAEDEYGRNL